ncbi:MAG: A/G-specific adenine glycosylase [Acidobacteriota bacterium]
MNPPTDALLTWYDVHRRDLPWREDQHPYRVWLSEIMLQQTRVDTVIPYFERFLESFPTVEDLAAAEIDDVLARWSGLGYYRRARQLHAAAQQIAEAGAFPTTLEGWLELPGIGPYTAAAVSSIAFGVVAPVLDGNVERVMARWMAYRDNPKTAAGQRTLRAAAAELVHRDRPGDSNQALMEVGAMVCTPRNPKCLLCPCREDCQARLLGLQEEIPPPRKRRQVERVRLGVAVVEQDDRVLLFRRPDDRTLLAGTWELPWFEISALSPSSPLDRTAAAEALAKRYGGSWSLAARRATIQHGITHRSLTVEVLPGSMEDAGEVAKSTVEAGWFDAVGRDSVASSSLVVKALAAYCS